MRAIGPGLTALQVLESLDDWKSVRDVAEELKMGVKEAKAILNELEEKRLIYRDGPMYIRRRGRA